MASNYNFGVPDDKGFKAFIVKHGGADLATSLKGAVTPTGEVVDTVAPPPPPAAAPPAYDETDDGPGEVMRPLKYGDSVPGQAPPPPAAAPAASLQMPKTPAGPSLSSRLAEAQESDRVAQHQQNAGEYFRAALTGQPNLRPLQNGAVASLEQMQKAQGADKKTALDAQAMDPNSPMSIAARKKFATLGIGDRMAKQMGPDWERMTAAQLDAQFPGLALVEAKESYDSSQRDKTAAATQAERDYQRQHDAIEDDLKKKGIEASLANAAATQALARASLGLRTQEHEDSQNDRVESDVQKLAKETGDTAVLISEKLARIKAVMAQHPKDLPGVGPVDSRVPAIALDSDAQSLQSDAREMVNTLLFLQSGAGVSNQERENKYRAYGVGEGSTEAAFRQGIAKLENDIAKALKAKQAGFRPKVVDTYKERGGVLPSDLTKGVPQTSNQGPASTGIMLIDGKGIKYLVQPGEVDAFLQSDSSMKRLQ